jgi:hypothetical protein
MTYRKGLFIYMPYIRKNAYNEEVLRKTVTEDNPLALIKWKDETTNQCQDTLMTHMT